MTLSPKHPRQQNINKRSIHLQSCSRTLLVLVIIILINGGTVAGISTTSQSFEKIEQVKQLVKKWSPLIWTAPGEQYFPSNLAHFLRGVHISDETGHILSREVNETHFPVNTGDRPTFLTTKKSLENLINRPNSFLNGQNPRKYGVSVYAIIKPCNSYRHNFNNNGNNPHLYFQVSYWAFYPYNKGKNICFLGGKVPTLTVFGRCFGRRKTMGSHVGDWEHVSLKFQGETHPSEMFLSVHNTGAHYKYDPHLQIFRLPTEDKNPSRKKMAKFPPIARLQNGHPILFSAEGSHGLWAAPGDHEYVKILHLVDQCGYGVPWKTWENLIVLKTDKGGDLPSSWLFFGGRWGNPTSNCILLGLGKKLGICEFINGPRGVLHPKRKQEFDSC